MPSKSSTSQGRQSQLLMPGQECFNENRKGTPQQQSINFIMTNMKIINTEWIKEALVADVTMNSVEGHNIQRMARLQKIIPDNIFEILDLQVQPLPRRWINSQGDRIVVPEALKLPVVERLHIDHQEETKCTLLAGVSIFYPGINQSIRNTVKECSKYQPTKAKLQLMQPDFSTHPWATIGMNINEQDQCKYLLVSDYN